MTEEDTHMADPTRGDDTGVGPGREYPGTPRWVKVSGIIVLVLVLLVGIMVLTGLHTPPGGGPGGHTPPIQHGVQQP